MTRLSAENEPSPFERIRRVNAAGNEHWSSREFAKVLGYSDYRNFEQVIDKAKIACFNSGQRIEDHFVDSTKMIGIAEGCEAVFDPTSFCLLPASCTATYR